MLHEIEGIDSRLLKRQIKKHLKWFDDVELKKMEKFIFSIQDEYSSVKEDRVLLERSLDISSEELSLKNAQVNKVLWRNIEINKKLEESMGNLELIVDNLWEWLVVVDPTWVIVLSNSRASLITWYTNESLIGKDYNDALKFSSDNSNVKIDDFIKNTLEKGKEFSINRNLIIHWEGNEQTPISLVASPLEKFSSKWISCIVVFKDATKERELDNLKNEFLSVASHELRTPMTVIKWYVSLLMRWKLWDINEKQKTYLEKIFGNTTQLIEMVNDMLDVNKLEAGKMDFSYDVFNIDTLLSWVIEDMQTLVKNKNITLSWNIMELEVFSDKRRIEQILINFISNAYKFTPENWKITVLLSVNDDNDSFTIWIEDNGMWIAEEHIWKLFKKFSQVWSHLNKTEKGTGLWLSICKEIAEWMHWSVWVKTELKIGSTFFVTLPINTNKKI